MENRDKRGNLLAFANDFQEGMQLRDYFAAKAMQADLTNYDGANWRRVAVQAYQMADAMIEARGNK